MFKGQNAAMQGNELSAERSFQSDGPNAPPHGRIVVAATHCDKLTEALHQEIASLETRLSAVLRPSNPQAASGQTEQARATPSPFAVGLEQHNALLESAIAYLRGLNARIDL
jgi:hypothetical protein